MEKPQETPLTKPDSSANSEIDCPACGETVKLVASATLSIALWQHWQWSCPRRLDEELRASQPTEAPRAIVRLRMFLQERITRAYDSMSLDRWKAFDEYCCENNTPASVLSFVEYLLAIEHSRGADVQGATPSDSGNAERATPDYKALYHELLYQVATKHPNETRHQTALRYLRQHETECGKGGPVSTKGER